MSYINPQDDTAAKDYSGYTVKGTEWARPRTATSASRRPGCRWTCWRCNGFTALRRRRACRRPDLRASTATSPAQQRGVFFDFKKNVDPGSSRLWDAGTGNTLDVSGRSAAAGTSTSIPALSVVLRRDGPTQISASRSASRSTLPRAAAGPTRLRRTTTGTFSMASGASIR